MNFNVMLTPVANV